MSSEIPSCILDLFVSQSFMVIHYSAASQMNVISLPTWYIGPGHVTSSELVYI